MSRTQHPISLLAATLAAMATVAALAGCSAAAPSSSTKAASSSSSTQSSAAASKKLDICGLLPVATVAQITGQGLTTATPNHSLDASGIYTCSYDTADGLAFIRVDVNTQTAKIAYDANYSAAGSTDDLSGLGDKAFGSMYHVEALFGDTDIEVLNQTPAGTDALEALVQKVHSVL